MTREEMIKALLAEVDNWDIQDLRRFAKTQLRENFEKYSDKRITSSYNMVKHLLRK